MIKRLKDSVAGWGILTWAGALVGMAIFVISQTKELTAPAVGALLLALCLAIGYQFSSRIKALEDKLGYRKMADEQAEMDSHCPGCGFPIDREGFLKDQDYSKDAKYDCPNCGRNLINIKATDEHKGKED